jgi:hypothetical protein
MKHLCTAFFGALLVLGLAGVPTSTPAQAAGLRWDPACNCNRPDSSFNTKRVVRGPARVVNNTRVVNHTRVVRGNTRLIQENQLVVHVRPVINRTVVVHRTNTVVKDLVVKRTNVTHKHREEVSNQVVHRHEAGSTRRVVEHKNVRGRDCNCIGGRSSFREATYRF